MTTYIDVSRYAQDDPIAGATPVAQVRSQIAGAIKDAAIAISAEPDTTDNYARRLALATGVANATGAALDRYVQTFLPLVLLNNSGALWAATAAGQTLADPDVLSSVAGLWNVVAGRDVVTP